MRANKKENHFNKTRLQLDTSPFGMKTNVATHNVPKVASKQLKASIEMRAQRRARNNPIPVPIPHTPQQMNEMALACRNGPISPITGVPN
jgi:hypothetical protein